VNPDRVGTKCAVWHALKLGAGESRVLRRRLYADAVRPKDAFGENFAQVVAARRAEAGTFYENLARRAART
jgi:hypothetical protein